MGFILRDIFLMNSISILPIIKVKIDMEKYVSFVFYLWFGVDACLFLFSIAWRWSEKISLKRKKNFENFVNKDFSLKNSFLLKKKSLCKKFQKLSNKKKFIHFSLISSFSKVISINQSTMWCILYTLYAKKRNQNTIQITLLQT